jgi:hypothetical protein
MRKQAKQVALTWPKQFHFELLAPGNISGAIQIPELVFNPMRAFRLARDGSFLTPPNADGVSFLIPPTDPVSPDGRSLAFSLANAKADADCQRLSPAGLAPHA